MTSNGDVFSVGSYVSTQTNKTRWIRALVTNYHTDTNTYDLKIENADLYGVVPLAVQVPAHKIKKLVKTKGKQYTTVEEVLRDLDSNRFGKPTLDDMRAVYNIVDSDGNGELDDEELEVLIGEFVTAWQSKIADQFASMEGWIVKLGGEGLRNRVRKVSQNVLTKLKNIKAVFDRDPSKAVAQLRRKLDVNGDGDIELKEFIVRAPNVLLGFEDITARFAKGGNKIKKPTKIISRKAMALKNKNSGGGPRPVIRRPGSTPTNPNRQKPVVKSPQLSYSHMLS